MRQIKTLYFSLIVYTYIHIYIYIYIYIKSVIPTFSHIISFVADEIPQKSHESLVWWMKFGTFELTTCHLSHWDHHSNFSKGPSLTLLTMANDDKSNANIQN